MSMRRFRAFFLLPAFLAALGCSGGGSSSAPITPPTTLTVTYNGNANTGGSVPVDANTYQQGQTVTLLGNTGNLVKTGNTFTGWNTLASGNGITYTQGQTCTMGSANLTFYAKWTPTGGSNSVTYDGNGATGGSVPVDPNSYSNGQTVTVLGNPGSLVYTGYNFVGWQTQADGSGTTYKQGQTFTKGATAVTLYALWAGGYAYVANSQGGSGGSISQYTIGPNGALTPMSTPTVQAGGSNTRYIAADPLGKYVYASNVSSNAVAQFNIGADGGLTPMTTPSVVVGTQAGPYYPCGLAVNPISHNVYVSIQQRSAVNQYSYGLDGALAPLTPATVVCGNPGNGRNGPVAIAIDSTGTFAYAANGGALTLSQYRIAADGTLAALSPFLVATGGIDGSGSAFDVKTASTPSGQYAYVTNYFDGTLGQFSINATTGLLTPLTPLLVSAGTYALTLAVHPSGKYAYVAILTATPNATVAQFTIDQATGVLAPMIPATVASGGAGAASIAIDPSGKYAYVTSGDTGWGSNSVAQYTIDPATGALTLMAHPTVLTGYGPAGIVTTGI